MKRSQLYESSRNPRCTFCGQSHRSKSDYRKCRQGVAPTTTPAAAERKQGTPTTRYENDSARGDKRAHAIRKKARAGMSPRKIAKALNVPLGVVDEALR